MKQSILVAGGTGNLGGRIINALLDRHANVRMIVREGTDPVKFLKLQEQGVEVIVVDMLNIEALTKVCSGVACVVSALQGLHDVIVDTQKALLDAAVAAGVPRFIPSDYSLDFTKLPAGENRNFDLRREFHQHLEKAPIAATSIFNGAFADILTYNIPVLDFKKKMVGYWGSEVNWQLDFTTMDETAAFTAAVALDSSASRALNIASFQVSPKELVAIASEVFSSPYNLISMGSLEDFAAYNRRQRAANPEGENETFPRWQSGQYMHDMFSTHHETLDNNRYPDLKWTSASDFIKSIF